jgi:hypothetical protein
MSPIAVIIPDMMYRIVPLLVMILAAVCAPSFSGQPVFPPGEKFTYSLRWEKVSAGEATLEILPAGEVEDEDALHFRMTARTNGFVDIFYKVRDKVDAYTDPGMERSLLYLKKQREGSYKRDITVTFDWDRLTARYHNKINGFKDPIRVLPGTYDPLTIFYAFRNMEVTEGAVLRRPVTDGVKLVIGEARVVGRETIEVPAGTYDCYVVKPDLSHLGGVFQKSPEADLTVWISADERKMPVMISSKVIVGRFYAVLTEARLPALAARE